MLNRVSNASVGPIHSESFLLFFQRHQAANKPRIHLTRGQIRAAQRRGTLVGGYLSLKLPCRGCIQFLLTPFLLFRPFQLSQEGLSKKRYQVFQRLPHQSGRRVNLSFCIPVFAGWTPYSSLSATAVMIPAQNDQ